MKKKLLLGLMAAAIAVPSFAAKSVNTPRDQRGAEASSDWAGYSQFRASNANETVVCSGRCLLKAIILSSGPNASYLRVRNSSVTQGNGALVLKYARFAPNVATSPGGSNPIAAPILLDKGITLELSSVSADEEALVLYLDLDD